MTPEAQRIAIAEAAPDTIRNHHGRWQYSDGIHWFNCKGNDPLADLNAMHEAEKALPDSQRAGFCSLLHMSVPESFVEGGYDGEIEWDTLFAIVHATAAQRGEAFLRTLGKWE